MALSPALWDAGIWSRGENERKPGWGEQGDIDENKYRAKESPGVEGTDGLSPTNRILYTLSLNTWARIFMSSYHPFYYTFSL